jgi:hypothetical protein
MRARSPILLVMLLGLTTLAGCDPDDGAAGTSGSTCAEARTAPVTLDALAVSLTLAADGDRTTAVALVADAMRLPTQLGPDQRLEVVSEDKATVAALPYAPGASCKLTHRADVATASLGRNATARLVDPSGERSVAFTVAVPYELTAPLPTDIVVGKESGVRLDRRFPSLVGDGLSESWSVELRGSCLDMKDTDALGSPVVKAAPLGGNGSSQPTGQTLAFQLAEGSLVAGSPGCDVEAAFVTTIFAQSGGGGRTSWRTTSVARTRFATRVRR